MPVSDTVMLEPLVDFGVLGREVEMSSTSMCADAAFIFERWLVSVQQVRIKTVRRATDGNASARVRRMPDTGGVWVGDVISVMLGVGICECSESVSGKHLAETTLHSGFGRRCRNREGRSLLVEQGGRAGAT